MQCTGDGATAPGSGMWTPSSPSPPGHFGTGTGNLVNHLEERLLDQVQAQASYTPPFFGGRPRARTTAHAHSIGTTNCCRIPTSRSRGHKPPNPKCPLVASVGPHNRATATWSPGRTLPPSPPPPLHTQARLRLPPASALVGSAGVKAPEARVRASQCDGPDTARGTNTRRGC